MFKDQTRTVIAEAWSTLAEPVRASILDQDYKHAVRNAVSGHVLNESEYAALEEEVLMVLLGLQSKADFARDLASQVPSLTARDAQQVAGHVDEHFFALLSPYLDQEQTPDEQPASAEGPARVLRGSASPLEQFIRRQDDVSARFTALPEEVRTTILSSEIAGTFGEIVRTHNLSQDQFARLGEVVVRVLVGLSTTKDFRAALPALGLSAESQDAFAATVEQGMFKPVRDAIGRVLAQRAATT